MEEMHLFVHDHPEGEFLDFLQADAEELCDEIGDAFGVQFEVVEVEAFDGEGDGGVVLESEDAVLLVSELVGHEVEVQSGEGLQLRVVLLGQQRLAQVVDHHQRVKLRLFDRDHLIIIAGS